MSQEQVDGLNEVGALAGAEDQPVSDVPAEVTETDEGSTPSVEPDEAPAPETDTPVFTYGGLEVDVQVEPEINDMFTEKGLDVTGVVSELYGGDEFGLSDETKEKLYEAFGKFSVDSYLSGLEARNDRTINQIKSESESKAQAADKAWEEVSSIVGGDEGWTALEQYADQNLSDQELEEFNEIMSMNNFTIQRLAISDLAQRAGLSGDGNGSGSVHPNQTGENSMAGKSNEGLQLIEAAGGDSRGSGDATPLSAQEYRDAYMALAENDYEGMAKLDDRRRAGINKGL